MEDERLIITVKKYLTSVRLNSFESLLVNEWDSCKDILDLYQVSVKFSKEVYELLSYFEIFFRNKIDEILSKSFGYDWLDTINWRDKHLSQISEVKEKLSRNKKDYNKNDIIASLHLGFWIHLFDKNYQSLLWYGSLNKIFPPKTNRQELSEKLKNIGELRNRVSHYEIIIKDLDLLTENTNNIINIVRVLDESLYIWIAKNCTIFQSALEVVE